MKILGGKFKGRNFYMPAGIRPTQNIVRKALFDIVGQELEGLGLLDLFAGSGAVGLDAISRGSKNVVLVEKSRKCSQVIEENLLLLNRDIESLKGHSCKVLNSDAFLAVKEFAKDKKRFDIVFVDPPYGRGLPKKALKTLNDYDILHPNSLVIIQHEKKEILPEKSGRFILYKRNRYGATLLSIYKLL